MIIRKEKDALLFVTQPDHAALAAEIMGQWRGHSLVDHPRRQEILRAVHEHDNGWIEEDRETHVDHDGVPLDFISVPAEVKHRIWPRAVGRIAAERGYEAALIAQHALTVHQTQRAEPSWRAFFDTMSRLRANCLAGQPRLARGRFLADYRFVRIGDLLSLVFCNGWSEPHDLPDGRRTILMGPTLRVSPDPFGGASVALRVPARRVPARRYASTDALRAALEAAPFETLEGQVTGGS